MKTFSLSSQGTWLLVNDDYPIKMNSSARIVPVAERIELTKRIVACVNACEGVPTEVLEAYTVLEKLREKDTQRAELLEALVIAVGSIEEICKERGVPLPNSTLSRSHAAIARAKGGVQ